MSPRARRCIDRTETGTLASFPLHIIRSCPVFRSIGFSLVAAISLAAAADSALASVSQTKLVVVDRVTVSYDDLDLSAPADTRVLLTRLEKAAFRACGGDPRTNVDYGMMGPRLEKMYRECRVNAVSRAVVEVDAPLLTQIHRDGDTQRLARATAG
jgi:UrcA family protein